MIVAALQLLALVRERLLPGPLSAMETTTT
jgi:hypothetical protein